MERLRLLTVGKQFGKDKFDRCRDLIRWGINAPSYVKLEKTTRLGLVMLLDILFELWDTCQLSFRCIPGETIKGEFFEPNRNGKWILENEEYLMENLPLMVSPGLPLSGDSKLWDGLVMVLHGDTIILEASTRCEKGPRDITYSRISPEVQLWSRFDRYDWMTKIDTCLVDVIDQARFVPLSNFVLEFSIFSMPVGIKNERLIFWEYEEVIHGFKERN